MEIRELSEDYIAEMLTKLGLLADILLTIAMRPDAFCNIWITLGRRGDEIKISS